MFPDAQFKFPDAQELIPCFMEPLLEAGEG